VPVNETKRTSNVRIDSFSIAKTHRRKGPKSPRLKRSGSMLTGLVCPGVIGGRKLAEPEHMA
jgi:hypothetical protein